jgi:hypothetical protein
MTGYSAYWIGQVARRFNEEGEDGLVNHRTRTHRPARRPDPRTLLPTEEDRQELRLALVGPAPQNDVWNSRTVAAGTAARWRRG